MDYNIDSISSGLLGGAVIFLGIILIILLPLLILEIIAFWKLFKKAGKPGWASIVPFYNSWVLVEIAGLNWWWFLLIIANSIAAFLDIDALTSIANIANLVCGFNCYYNISKKFNKDTTFSVFAGIFNFIFVLILGLSKKEVYDINAPVSPNGIFGQQEVKNNTNNYNNVNDNYNNNTFEQNNSQFNSENVSYCGNCGTKLNENERFCPNCGTEKK